MIIKIKFIKIGLICSMEQSAEYFSNYVQKRTNSIQDFLEIHTPPVISDIIIDYLYVKYKNNSRDRYQAAYDKLNFLLNMEEENSSELEKFYNLVLNVYRSNKLIYKAFANNDKNLFKYCVMKHKGNECQYLSSTDESDLFTVVHDASISQNGVSVMDYLFYAIENDFQDVVMKLIPSLPVYKNTYYKYERILENYGISLRVEKFDSLIYVTRKKR